MSLKLWEAIKNQVPEDEDPLVLGGRAAEEFLKKYILAFYDFGDAVLLSRRRVPGRRGGRREIDLIVCTRRMIHSIEVKNWSGSLRDCGDIWEQTARSGEVRKHKNLFKDNEDKRRVLADYLNEKVQLDREFWRNHSCEKIFFMNRKLEMDPRIATNPNVVTPDKINGYLSRHKGLSLLEGWTTSIIELCLDSEASEITQRGFLGAMPSGRFDGIVKHLRALSTWDELHFFGSKIQEGDLIRMTINKREFGRTELEKLISDRQIVLNWSRATDLWSSVWSWTKAATCLGSVGYVNLGSDCLELSADDTVIFHVPGEEKPSTISLLKVDRIVLG